MTTYDISSGYGPRPVRRPNFLSRFGASLASAATAAGRHRDERREVIQLSRLDPRRLNDMGFDPEAIYDAVDGTWDELPSRPRLPKV